ncbi:MAG: hypothetical protein ACOYK6_05655 [Chthoniobacterales bacterium]
MWCHSERHPREGWDRVLEYRWLHCGSAADSLAPARLTPNGAYLR